MKYSTHSLYFLDLKEKNLKRKKILAFAGTNE